MSVLIQNGIVLTGSTRGRMDVRIDQGIIAQVSPSLRAGEGDCVIDAAGLYVAPGFVDIHTHGGANVDVNHAAEADLETVAVFFASHGVTGWQCSILTDTREQTLHCIRQARSYAAAGHPGARLLGIHLEGPFLSRDYRGSMPEHLLHTEFDLELVRSYQEAAGGLIRYITVSPEIAGAPEAIPALRELGIRVSIGHSGADYDTAWAAIRAGAEAATHTMNAMLLLHQHRPAITGAVLESDVYCETICDGIHLHPGTVRLILKTKGLDRVVAITDSIMAAGLPDGRYQLGVNDVTVEGGDAKITGTDIRAGSTLTMDRALRNLVKFTGEAPETVLPLLTQNPARLLGFDKMGEVAVGMAGDLVLLREDLTVAQTLVGGASQFKGPHELRS